MATSAQKRDRLHQVSVAGNTVAGTTGAALGAAKLRDTYRDDPRYGAAKLEAHASRLERVGRHIGPKTSAEIGHMVRVGTPRTRTLVLASSAGAVAAGAHRLGQHIDRKAGRRAAVVKRETVRERVRQAKNPPEVRLRPVDSTAVSAIGYQRQTRRLAVEMHSRLGQPYVYRASPKLAAKVTGAQSKGRAYTQNIRGKAERDPKVRVRDRARLFAKPERSSVSKGMFGGLFDAKI